MLKKQTICLLIFSACFVTLSPACATDYDVFQVTVMSDTWILPDTDPANFPGGVQSNNVTLTSAKGKYQPFSFVVHANTDLSNLMVTASDLTSGSNTIPTANVDLRVVKCWYRGGNLNQYNAGTTIAQQLGGPDPWGVANMSPAGYSPPWYRILIPELLLHDDSLVTVDTTAKTNSIGGQNISVEGGPTPNVSPQDASTLQATSLSSGQNKQYYGLINIPSNAAAGTYTGTLTVTATGKTTTVLNVSLTVIATSLQAPQLKYGTYYQSWLVTTTDITDYGRSTAHWTKEIQNMAAHGIQYPGLYLQGIMESPGGRLADALAIMGAAGMPKGRVINAGDGIRYWMSSVENANRADAINIIIHGVGGWESAVQWFMSTDEPPESIWNDYLQTIIPAVQAKGCKVWGAITDDLWGLTNFKTYMDAVNYHGPWAPWSLPPRPSDFTAPHELWLYGRPQSGSARGRPNFWRYNYGWWAYANGYNGCFPYTYQETRGTGFWNDFDDPILDECLTYPTNNGVVDTLQWEGFREAVDDMRYLATLKYAIANPPGGKEATAAAAQAWLNAQSPTGDDLDNVRAEMIGWIRQINKDLNE